MKQNILLSFFILLSFQSFSQNKERLFGGNEINISVLFLSPYFEFGEDGINHFGIGGGVNVYKRLFIGAFGQWGKWSPKEATSDFVSSYNQTGFWLGHFAPLKNRKYSIVTSCYLGRGKSTSEQNTPIAFTDAQIRFVAITPEIGLDYRFMTFGTLILSTGYHIYSRTDQDENPIGFDGFEMNQFYMKIGIRIGL